MNQEPEKQNEPQEDLEGEKVVQKKTYYMCCELICGVLDLERHAGGHNID